MFGHSDRQELEEEKMIIFETSNNNSRAPMKIHDRLLVRVIRVITGLSVSLY